jgi:predicted MFS family arabinose efflux permease
MFVYTSGATAVAGDLGVPTAYIGYQVGLAYFSATICSLFSGAITRQIGYVQSLALSTFTVAAGAYLTTIWSLAGMAVGSVLMGLGFGLIPAATARLLMSVTTENRRAFIFSIKQSGIPIGGLLAAVTTPTITEQIGWRWAGYIIVVLGLLLTVILIFHQKRWIIEERETRLLSYNPLNPILVIVRNRDLRLLIYMAICYISIQNFWWTYLSPFFVEDLKFGLVEAGIFLAVVQIAGIVGRPFWGWLADVLQDNLTAMAILGVIMTVCCIVAPLLTPETPKALLYLLSMLIGISATSWNGVFHAALLQAAPKGDAILAIAGMAFFVYVAMFAWPIGFAIAIQISGNYPMTIAMFSITGLIGTICAYNLKSNRTTSP